MGKQQRTRLGLLCLGSLFAGLAAPMLTGTAAGGPVRKGTVLQTPPPESFFQAYENGDYAGAMKTIPPALRDLSPYEKGKENLPLYKRDEPVYFDIMEKLSGEKPLPPQAPEDKEIQYYLGVMHYRLNDLEAAKRKFLKCLQLDPSYRMAHVYLFRIFARWEDELAAGSGGKSESMGELMIEKLGFGSSDQHLQSADELLRNGTEDPVPVIRLDFVMDNGTLKNLKTNHDVSPDAESRGRLNDEMKAGKRYRIEMVNKDRHCLDEAFIDTEQTVFWDGRDPSGQLTGGRRISKSFPGVVDLAAPGPAERIVIYDPAGKKIMEVPVPGR